MYPVGRAFFKPVIDNSGIMCELNGRSVVTKPLDFAGWAPCCV